MVVIVVRIKDWETEADRLPTTRSMTMKSLRLLLRCHLAVCAAAASSPTRTPATSPSAPLEDDVPHRTLCSLVTTLLHCRDNAEQDPALSCDSGDQWHQRLKRRIRRGP